MKSILLKILLTISLFFIYNCKAQTATQYITFYNELVPKLNTIIPNKTQFYGQNFSNFSNELMNKNIDIVLLNYEPKMDPGSKYYVLRLYFSNMRMWSVASENSFRYPSISVTFQNEIPKQIEDIAKQNNMQWNNTIQQFFANMKIEKITFIGMNGYNSPDRTVK
ncbi:hypothetical protein [Chryseobacterium vrystaatense]|uniref:Uncharacterized protein n=1 Tax=Chryseobacterium vrystaatense TaxID=307480 RepID=A0A1M5I9L2_9FLAO|nr:hypothetical protein [Chryseobacterium vrystaatense]SHG24941.1 hypothetical protein SAMN02787073_3790 [Chryseobacterium vrystaatense]